MPDRGIAVYPGTFDPVTLGPLDIIERAARQLEHAVLSGSTNSSKAPLFSLEERMALVKEATAALDNIEVDSFDGLLVDYARRRGAHLIVKGLRVVSDFEYE